MTAGTAQIRRPRSAGHQSTRACGTVVLQESSGGRHRQSFSREGGAAGPDVPPGVGCFRAKTALAPPENCAHKRLKQGCETCADGAGPASQPWRARARQPCGRRKKTHPQGNRRGGRHTPRTSPEKIFEADAAATPWEQEEAATGEQDTDRDRGREAVTANEEKGEEGGVERRHRARRGPRRHLPRALAKKKRSSRARPSGAQREGSGRRRGLGRVPGACALTRTRAVQRGEEARPAGQHRSERAPRGETARAAGVHICV
ncbi:unnamed protein product [Prorocentrum cordatum]|uniref:Uncharacterized protein n=1 Tax=Prorocentrum cordatum TaxID=2364126 RepID=A0ABN9QXE2_9DINO|nr:unnamed protein product [Polarella glacialis]